MRHRLSALLGVLLIGCCLGEAVSAPTGSRWWPFGRSDAEQSQPPAIAADSAESPPAVDAQQVPASQDTPADEPEVKWMIDSPLARVSWPRFRLPEIPKPHLPEAPLRRKKSEVDADRNAWLDSDAGSNKTSPLQAMSAGARRVADGSRAAWDKTVDVLTPGDNSPQTSSRVARRDTRPPWWQRMFAAEEEQPRSPRTVTEWMAQDRLDP